MSYEENQLASLLSAQTSTENDKFGPRTRTSPRGEGHPARPLRWTPKTLVTVVRISTLPGPHRDTISLTREICILIVSKFPRETLFFCSVCETF